MCSESDNGEEGDGNHGKKGRGEIGSEIRKVPGMAADVPTTDSSGKRIYDGWVMGLM